MCPFFSFSDLRGFPVVLLLLFPFFVDGDLNEGRVIVACQSDETELFDRKIRVAVQAKAGQGQQRW